MSSNRSYCPWFCVLRWKINKICLFECINHPQILNEYWITLYYWSISMTSSIVFIYQQQKCLSVTVWTILALSLHHSWPGRVAQSVTCLATDACLTADPGVASSIPARYHTFVEIDHEIISTVILLLPLIYSRRVVVSYKRKYVHKLLVNRLLKPAQEKVWLSELTVPQWP